jgi:uncharacterized LabA/DUF88 family protein
VDQFAVFVDAGYFYAQGSNLLFGKRLPRSSLSTHIDEFETAIRAVATAKAPGRRLLRIYWYDGILRGHGATRDQQRIAERGDIKLRLGMVNSRGEQKEVDALIVTDIVELARNRAMSDAFLLAGDGDLRIGISLAQNFGVRTHLVGLKPARGSMSPELIAEADSLTEWDAGIMKPLLSCTMHDPAAIGEYQTAATTIAAIVASIVATIHGPAAVLDFITANDGSLPPDINGHALATARKALGRDLDPDEKRQLRKALKDAIRAAATAGRTK